MFNFIFGASGSTAEIASFFTNYSSSGDVGSALGTASLAFKFALATIMIIGAIAMAIWMLRIAVDILLLVFRGTKITEGKLASFGTGEAGNYGSVGSYVKGNIIEIVLMILLIVFLMTGWIFQLIALAVTGFGIIGNKLLGIDLEGKISSLEASSYVEGVQLRKKESLKAEYDEQLGKVRTQASILYDLAAQGENQASPKFKNSMRIYTVAFAKADILGKEVSKDKGASNFNLNESYFKQHLSVKQNVCNVKFIETSITDSFKTAGAVITTTCSD